MIKIIGGSRLSGVVKPAGAKNTALPVLAGALLSEGSWVFTNSPNVGDAQIMLKLQEELGCKIKALPEKHQIKIKVPGRLKKEISNPIFSTIRGSIFLLGAMLAREGEVFLPYPGGCNIGQRPIDLHIKGLEALGVKFDLSSGLIHAKVMAKKANRVYLDYPSVGATENLMLFASLLPKEVVIDNAAQEPQVVDLGNFLKTCGVKIWGLGSHTLRIKGVEKLSPVIFPLPSDPLEAGTFLIGGVLTRGDVTVKDVDPRFLNPLLYKLKEMGIQVMIQNGTHIRAIAKEKPMATNIKTLPFPGFPTDLQPQMTTLLAVSEGTSLVVETVFESRFQHVRELNKMGAQIAVEGRQAVIQGVDKLFSADVEATDIRAGSALVLAGLSAEGETRIYGTEHIHRGYENMIGKLKNLGADISSSKEEVKANEEI